jgi:hypothetical protein
MKPLTTLAACAAALGAPLAASATDFDTLNNLSQAEFALFTKDLGAATSYKQLASAAPLGVAGFDIAVASAFTNTQYPDLWSKAAGNADIPGTVPVPGIRIAKGLPFGIDIGATYATLPKVDAKLAGVELRWALLEGGLVSPAVGLRVAATKLSGVDQLSLSNASFDVSISKGFPFITPYAGVGAVRTSAKVNGATTLQSESPTQARVFAGLHLNLGLFDITAEGDKTGKTTSYSARLGFRF